MSRRSSSARAASVIWSVVTDGARLVLMGVVVGLPVAWASRVNPLAALRDE